MKFCLNLNFSFETAHAIYLFLCDFKDQVTKKN